MISLFLLSMACEGRPEVDSEADLSALQAEVVALSEELAALTEELDALSQSNEELSDATRALSESQSELDAEVESLGVGTDEHAELLDSLNDSVVTLLDETDGAAEFLSYVSTDTTNHAIKFTGANIYIQSGSGYTDDGYHLKLPGWATLGLGNFIVGYDEDDGEDDKGGSHNIVVGRDHSYPSYGGLVVGYNNTISGQFSSVTGGHSNSAEARTASVSGGRYNRAANYYSWVGGGYENLADEWFASVMGGAYNESTGECGVLVGGDSLIDSTDLCDETP